MAPFSILIKALRNPLVCSKALATNTTRIATISAATGDKTKTALVLGCSGALGSSVSSYLGRNLGMKVLGADVAEIPGDFNGSDWELDGFIPVPKYTERPSIADVTETLASGVYKLLGDDDELDAVVVASGGWAGDPQPTSGDLTLGEIQQGAQEYGENIEKMLFMNLVPVIAAGYTVQRFAGPHGLFVVIGATAALDSTPGMMGYGIAKSASHHIVTTIGATTGNAMGDTKNKRKIGRRFRQHAENLDTLSVVGILPTTIDTPSNRKFNPNVDYSTWTKPRDIAEEIGRWIEVPPLRPHSGALVKVTSEESGSTFEIVR